MILEMMIVIRIIIRFCIVIEFNSVWTAADAPERVLFIANRAM